MEEEEEEEEGGRKAKPGPHLVSSTLANESAVDDGLLLQPALYAHL